MEQSSSKGSHVITVADIIALPAFKRIELAAPCPGAGARGVRNVGILDLAPDEQAYADYLPGEFIVSNLGFARNDPDLMEASLLALIARNVAAVAVKTVYHPAIGAAVRAASEARGVPLYLYEATTTRWLPTRPSTSSAATRRNRIRGAWWPGFWPTTTSRSRARPSMG